MGQRQSHDRAAGLRVLVGRAVPLPVVADNQPFSSRGNEGGFLVQHLVDVDSPPLGLGLFPTSEMAAIPVENRAGRRLAGLDRVQPLDRGVGVAAGSSRAEDPGATAPGGRCSIPRSRQRRRHSWLPGRASRGRRRFPPGPREFRHQDPGPGPPPHRAVPLPCRAGRSGRATCPAGRQAPRLSSKQGASRRRAGRSST